LPAGGTLPGMADAAQVLEPETIPADELVEEELLVEEISIDGMCGVY
jgi:mycofactocin precursor